MTTKVSVIGSGKLGSKIAYTIAQRGIADSVVVVDILADVALGNAMDIAQSVAYVNDCEVISGGYEEIKDSSVVVVTAGKPRTPDMKDRLELAKVNAKIVSSVCAGIRKYAPDSVVVICSNPMDLMNYAAFKALGFPASRVIGFGGRLDSARFKYVVAKHLGVAMRDLSCDVVGEHGESMVPLFSRVRLKGKKVEFSDADRKKITSEVRGIALQIIKLKGITDFAPASCVADMVDAIVNDSGLVAPCSMNFSDASVGVPVRLGKSGAEPVEWKMTDEEKHLLDESSEKLKKMVSMLGV